MGEPKINHQVNGQFDVLLKTDLILIGKEESLIQLTKNFCAQFSLKCIYFHTTTDFHESYKPSLKPGLVIYKKDEALSDSELKSQYKNLKTVLKKTALCVISEKEVVNFVNPPDFSFVGTGVGNEIVQYLFYMKLKGDSYEIKHDDLFPSSVVSFNAYHLTPISKKFLPVVFQKLPLSEKKFSKLEKIKKLFIRGSDTSLYKDYVESFFDDSDFGSKKRAKAHLYQYLGYFFQLKYSFLVGLPTEELKDISKNMLASLQELKKYLDKVPQPFHYIFAHTKNDFLAYDQSWFVALTSSYVGLKLNLPHELIFSRIAMVLYPEVLQIQVRDRFPQLDPAPEEKAALDAMFGGEPVGRLSPEVFAPVFIQQFFTGFAQMMDFRRDVSSEDFMTTSRSYWRHQNELHRGEAAQKLLVSMRDLFCT